MFCTYAFGYDHITHNAPDPIRTLRLTCVEPAPTREQRGVVSIFFNFFEQRRCTHLFLKKLFWNSGVCTHLFVVVVVGDQLDFHEGD